MAYARKARERKQARFERTSKGSSREHFAFLGSGQFCPNRADRLRKSKDN